MASKLGQIQVKIGSKSGRGESGSGGEGHRGRSGSVAPPESREIIRQLKRAPVRGAEPMAPYQNRGPGNSNRPPFDCTEPLFIAPVLLLRF